MDWWVSACTAAIYAMFLRNLICSGGLGADEVIRSAQRNSEIWMSSVFVGVFASLGGVLCRVLDTTLLANTQLSFAWRAGLFGAVLLGLYAITGLLFMAVPSKQLPWKPLLLRRMGMSILNTLVMAVPLLAQRTGEPLQRVLGLGLGAGLAYFIVAILLNSSMQMLQQNRNVPAMFSGLPVHLIYLGLLALAFTGFTGEVLFQ